MLILFEGRKKHKIRAEKTEEKQQQKLGLFHDHTITVIVNYRFVPYKQENKFSLPRNTRTIVFLKTVSHTSYSSVLTFIAQAKPSPSQAQASEQSQGFYLLRAHRIRVVQGYENLVNSFFSSSNIFSEIKCISYLSIVSISSPPLDAKEDLTI